VDLDEHAVIEARRFVLKELCPGAPTEIQKSAAKHLVAGDSLLDPLGNRLHVEDPSRMLSGIDGATSRGRQTKLDLERSTSPDRRFSWTESFPDIFPDNDEKSRGFHLVIGNPPWEIMKPQDKEFFDCFSPSFSKLAKDLREKRKKELLENPRIRNEYSTYLKDIEQRSRAIRESPLYRWQRLNGGRGSWAINPNTFRLFVELGFYLTRPGGWCSFLVPSSFMGELGSSGIRRLLLDKGTLEWIIAFHPAVKAFGKVDHPFCMFLVQRGGKTVRYKGIEDAHSMSEVEDLLSNAPSISRSFLDRVVPDTHALVSARTTTELNILKKIHSFPALGTRSSDSWNAHMARDLDETNDRHMLTSERTRYRFLKGRAVFPFLIKTDQLKHWIRPEMYSHRDGHCRVSRVIWRDVTRPNMARRMYSTVCPPGFAIGNSLNYIVPNQTEKEKIFLTAVMNSLVFEYRARQISRNSHMNMFVVSQIPIPRLACGNQYFNGIVHETQKILNNELVLGNEGAAIQARIDAIVARMYGLTKKELGYLLGTYPRVNPEYKAQVMKEYQEDRHCAR
jgi:Alw26I/Eco31I/Esp3I family type II restriction m6 adenine DNA methyltransferase